MTKNTLTGTFDVCFLVHCFGVYLSIVIGAACVRVCVCVCLCVCVCVSLCVCVCAYVCLRV